MLRDTGAHQSIDKFSLRQFLSLIMLLNVISCLVGFIMFKCGCSTVITLQLEGALPMATQIAKQLTQQRWTKQGQKRKQRQALANIHGANTTLSVGGGQAHRLQLLLLFRG
jgi:hypothetical protein